jgi:1,4-alpha-glucan branching enzyme
MSVNPESVPMGANLADGGSTFRLWAPNAQHVSVRGAFNGWKDTPLTRISNGHWFVAIPGVKKGDEYKYFVVGEGTEGFKRDPYARSIADPAAWPHSNCTVTQPAAFPWHDQWFRPPAFSDVVIYQLHVGAYYSVDEHGVDRRRTRPGRFLDVLFRLEYLADLGINAIQLLPIQEFSTPRSMGYNDCDYFSPEMDYGVPLSDPEFSRYLVKANALLAARGCAPFKAGDLDSDASQLMALVDLCHVYGIAVIFDVCYNHAGGGLDDESMYFLDRQPPGDNNRSLYFTDQGWAGGLVFAFWNAGVRQFLIDNASLFLDEYHGDGFRYDEVGVIDRFGGWQFIQDITDTVRYTKPQALQIAEFWGDQSAALRSRAEGGAGFDTVLGAGMRQAVRDVVGQAASGRDVHVNIERLRDALYPPFGGSWRSVQHLENQDLVRINNDSDRQPRVPAMADPSNPRSWYARSRSRVANGLLLTGPGIPMLFMGQELLEDKYWSDSPNFFENSVIWWDGLDTDAAMRDHLRFVRELLAVRRQLPALRGDPINVFHVHNDNRVIAFHRWIEGAGMDVVVVASLREDTWWSYDLGFPRGGDWAEAFNSDVYDGWVNPVAAGNGGHVFASGPPLHGMPTSARIVIPANSVLIFAAR